MLWPVLAWLILGAIVGFITSNLLSRGDARLLLDVVLGITASIGGGALVTRLVHPGSSFVGVAVAILCAAMTCFARQAIARRRKSEGS